MSWIDDRPGTYDEDKYFDIATETWVAGEKFGGGRYKVQLVAVGQDDDGDGVIYYG